jgi:hypothetical protein
MWASFGIEATGGDKVTREMIDNFVFWDGRAA